MLLLETLYCNVNFFFHPLGIPLLTVPRHLDFEHNPCLKHYSNAQYNSKPNHPKFDKPSTKSSSTGFRVS